MRKVNRLSPLLVVCMFSITNGAALAAHPAASSEAARITEARGHVYKRGFIDWSRQAWADPVKAGVGDELKEGMQVGTGDRSWAQLAWRYVITRAWANSVYAIAPNQRLVYLVGGEMLFQLDKNRKDHQEYYVWTSLLQARVRGTTVLVQVDGPISRISVLEGTIDVMNRVDHSVIQLRPGIVYEVKAKELAPVSTDIGSLTSTAPRPKFSCPSNLLGHLSTARAGAGAFHNLPVITLAEQGLLGHGLLGHGLLGQGLLGQGLLGRDGLVSTLVGGLLGGLLGGTLNKTDGLLAGVTGDLTKTGLATVGGLTSKVSGLPGGLIETTSGSSGALTSAVALVSGGETKAGAGTAGGLLDTAGGSASSHTGTASGLVSAVSGSPASSAGMSSGLLSTAGGAPGATASPQTGTASGFASAVSGLPASSAGMSGGLLSTASGAPGGTASSETGTAGGLAADGGSGLGSRALTQVQTEGELASPVSNSTPYMGSNMIAASPNRLTGHVSREGSSALTSMVAPSEIPVAVFETPKTITSLFAADSKSLLSSHLITAFASELPSQSLILSALSNLPGSSDVIKAAATIVRVPLLSSYNIGTQVGKTLPLPATDLNHWPPTAYIGSPLTIPYSLTASQGVPANGSVYASWNSASQLPVVGSVMGPQLPSVGATYGAVQSGLSPTAALASAQALSALRNSVGPLPGTLAGVLPGTSLQALLGAPGLLGLNLGATVHGLVPSLTTPTLSLPALTQLLLHL